jgi:cytochrome b6-f complex iron-sulfur subunit
VSHEATEPRSHEGHSAGSSLETSPRFAPPKTRRDFLGLAAIWTAAVAWVGAAIGAFRLPMPAVFPESNSSVKIGPPDRFKPGSATHLAELGLWVFRDAAGLYAISTVCTHLGCIVARDEVGAFSCPCHGSKFRSDGKVLGGPAPKGLNWLAMTVAPDGQVVVDKVAEVKPGTRLAV